MVGAGADGSLCDGGRIRAADLGTTLHDGYTHGADLRIGTGSGVGGGCVFGRGSAYGVRSGGRRTHSDGYIGGRVEGRSFLTRIFHSVREKCPDSLRFADELSLALWTVNRHASAEEQEIGLFIGNNADDVAHWALQTNLSGRVSAGRIECCHLACDVRNEPRKNFELAFARRSAWRRIGAFGRDADLDLGASPWRAADL